MERPPARNARRLAPPRDKARRRQYYALMGRAKKASSLAQRLYLLGRARALMEWVEVDGPIAGAPRRQLGKFPT